MVELQALLGRNLPNFGPYAKQRKEAMAAVKTTVDLLDDKFKPEPNRPANKQRMMTPKVQEVIGKALDRIGTFNDLDSKQHVIALIDPEMCINCGEDLRVL